MKKQHVKGKHKASNSKLKFERGYNEKKIAVERQQRSINDQEEVNQPNSILGTLKQRRSLRSDQQHNVRPVTIAEKGTVSLSQDVRVTTITFLNRKMSALITIKCRKMKRTLHL
jgi:hypothetical protein